MNINDYKDVNGNVEVSETLVSDIIDGINGVVESGSNENGNWVKFEDGTQICYRQSSVNYTITTRQTFSLPAAFNTVHAVSVFPTNAIIGDTQIKCDATAFKAHKGSVWEIAIREVGFSSSVSYGFFAIGRWK